MGVKKLFFNPAHAVNSLGLKRTVSKGIKII
jgi:hypothetical protein